MKKSKVIVICFILGLILNIPMVCFALTEKEMTFPDSKTIKIVEGITNNSDYEYYYTDSSIYKYDIVNDSFEELYKVKKGETEYFPSCIIRGDTIYVYVDAFYNAYLLTVDVNTKEAKKIDISDNKYIDPYFLIDDNGYIYTNSNSTGTYMFYSVNINNIDELVDSFSYNSTDEIFLDEISPDNSLIFIDKYHYYGYAMETGESYIRIKDGHFTNETVEDVSEDRTPKWTFLKDNIRAFNQYGEIVEFKDGGSGENLYSLVKSSIGYSSFHYTSNAIEHDNSFLVPLSNGIIYDISKDTYKYLGIYELNQDGIYHVTEKNNKIYALHYTSDDKYYRTVIDKDEEILSKVINYTTHTTLNYDKDDVIQKYIESKPVYDYSSGDYFKKKPVYDTTNYFEGVLKDEIVNDVLKSYNMYRYLSGLNQVGINTDKMVRSQRGAFILGALNELTHTPARPSWMSQDFYQEAYYGVNARYVTGDTYSGNVSAGDAVYDLVEGFIDELGNVSHNVGHRSSMLEPSATAISFGYMPYKESGASYSYGDISVYYDGVNKNPDKFYAWPPAGYLPVETFPALSTGNAMWSIWLDKDIKVTSDSRVTIIFRGQEYRIRGAVYDSMEQTLYYSVPEELNNLVRRANGQYVTDEPITFKYTDFAYGIDTINIEYTTTFVQAEEIKLDKINLNIRINDYLSEELLDKEKFNLNQVYEYWVSFSPSNATIDKIVVSVDDPTILRLDTENKTITPIKGGVAHIILKDTRTNYTREIEVTVDVPSVGVTLDKKSLELTKGDKMTLKAELIPNTSSDSEEFTWKSSNQSVAKVENGTVTAVGTGTATITVETTKGYTAECFVTVNDYLKGDLNENGTVNSLDALEALYFAIGERDYTPRKIAIGDFNGDNKIMGYDAIEIIKLYIG